MLLVFVQCLVLWGIRTGEWQFQYNAVEVGCRVLLDVKERHLIQSQRAEEVPL